MVLIKGGFISNSLPKGEQLNRLLDEPSESRGEGGVTGGHQDGSHALGHQAVHCSVESLV
jgi:hypothetical protein